MAEAPPNPKIPATGYRWCPHCNSQVAERTYRSHRAAFFPSGYQRNQNGNTLSESPMVGTGPTESLGHVPSQTTEEAHAASSVGGASDTGGESTTVDDSEDLNYFDAHFMLHTDELCQSSSGSDEEGDLSPDKNLLSSESESEEESSESESETESPRQSMQPADNGLAALVAKCLVVFICFWQSAFRLPDIAIDMLLKFLVGFIKVIADKCSVTFLASVASKIPSSIYRLRKYLDSTHQQSFIEYVVCPMCLSLYTMEQCVKIDQHGEKVPQTCSFIRFPNHPFRHLRKMCGATLVKKFHLMNGKIEYRPRYVYAYQSIKNSLQRLLNKPGFLNKLEHWRSRCRSDCMMSDIYDGDVWADFCSKKFGNFLQYKRNYGVMLNFDFFQPYKHTTESYGVFYLIVMNLPRSERFKKENVLLVGIIPPLGHEPASLNTFMRPLVDELKEFWVRGVRLNTAESPRYKVLFKLALMCVACDIPAARKCCGFKGHSANYGCSRCMKFFPGGFGEKKDYSGFDRSQWQPRVYEAHIEVVKQILKCNTQNAIEALETETGVKHSILTELPYFNPIRFTIIDPMHNFFLGTAKTVMKKIWLERGIISGTQLDTIQARVDSLQVPSDIGRIPTKIASNFSGFTAEQLKNWVILYSMYALRGIISQDEYHCWQSFVLVCFFLCRRSVSRVDVTKADTLLVKFCQHMERLYGKDYVTPNMHLHCHMAECIKDFGSVYGFWCFSYERYNGILGSFPTNKKNVASQLMRRFISETNSCSLTIPAEFSHAFEHLLSTIVSHEPSEIHRHISSCEVSTCFDFSCISLPKTYKTSTLSTSDFDNLKVVYKNLYNNDENYVYTRSIKILKTLRIYGQQFGSIRDPRTKNNSFILAAWASDDGSISSVGVVRPGKVLYYVLNKVLIGTEHREHLFAVVGWFKEHRCRMLYGKPLEVWNYAQYVGDGPATFLPIHKVTCRFSAGYGRVASPFGGHEQVMFVSPLPTFTYF